MAFQLTVFDRQNSCSSSASACHENLLPTSNPPTSPLKTKFQVGANWWRRRAPTNGSNQATLFVAERKPSLVKERSKTLSVPVSARSTSPRCHHTRPPA